MAGDKTDNANFDLSRQRIGTIYAKALLSSAEEAGNTEAVLQDFESLLSDVIAQREDLRHALVGSILNVEERQLVLDKAFAGKMEPLLLTFLKVVTQHGRQDCLREIYAAAVELNNQRLGVVEVVARTAFPLADDLRDSLAAQVRQKLGREVHLKTMIDPDVIGGLILHIGDTVIDGSVANRLAQLRHQALESTAQQARTSLERFTVSS